MTKGLTAGPSGLNTFLIARNHGLHPWLQYGRPFRPFSVLCVVLRLLVMIELGAVLEHVGWWVWVEGFGHGFLTAGPSGLLWFWGLWVVLRLLVMRDQGASLENLGRWVWVDGFGHSFLTAGPSGLS